MTEASRTTCADLEAFIIAKYDPLLAIVKELNDSLQALERDKLRLERRVLALEQCLAEKGNATFEKSKNGQESDQFDNDSAALQVIHNESGLLPPWLFSCQTNTPISSMQVLLEFPPLNTMELDVQNWVREEHMWVAFFEQIPANVNFKYENDELGDLQSMRRIARRALLELVSREILIVVRNVPGKAEAASKAATITLVAILASAISEAWHRAEASTPQNMGRVALVLEGDNIGTRLRAGTKRFKIAPLN